MIHRRLFLGGLLAAAAGPAIIRAESLMPVRSLAIRLPDSILDAVLIGSYTLCTGDQLTINHRRVMDFGRGRKNILHDRKSVFTANGFATVHGNIRELVANGTLIPGSFA